jgi:hypothetical protein
MNRRKFLAKLTLAAGSAAAASSLLMPSKKDYANAAIKYPTSRCARVIPEYAKVQPQHITGFRILASFGPELNM